MKYVYLGLGSNLGDKRQLIQEAAFALDSHKKINLLKSSSLYETEPVGYKEQDSFINAVLKIETSLDPYALLECCLSIEKKMGRCRNRRWGPRRIDIDILLYQGFRSEDKHLTLPHPRMLERGFVLVPLVEIAPDLRVENVTIAELAQNSNGVEKLISSV